MRVLRSILPPALAVLVLAWTAAASAGEFGGYRRPDPQRFAEGVAAYDAQQFQKAYEIWLPLAHHGDLAAVYNIGLMLRDGRGIAQDLPRALAFFAQAAKWGHLGAEVNLANMYAAGHGTRQNLPQAARWRLVAARQGHLPSAYALGLMFEKGQGMKKPDIETAQTLYLIAARGGYELAANRLALLANARATGKPPPDASSGEATPPTVPEFRLRGSIAAVPEPGASPWPSLEWKLRTSLVGPDVAVPRPIARPDVALRPTIGAPTPRPRPSEWP